MSTEVADKPFMPLCPVTINEPQFACPLPGNVKPPFCGLARQLPGHPAFQVRTMMNLLAYCDGNHDLIDIAERLDVPVDALFSHVDRLVGAGILETAQDREAYSYRGPDDSTVIAEPSRRKAA
jgi:hypothetical protein